MMAKWAKETVPALKQALNNISSRAIPVFCYRGMSGTGLATVLQQAWFNQQDETPGMIYVRKPSEKSHSYRDSEYFLPDPLFQQDFVLVFVDDFVSSGKTRVRTMTVAVEETKYKRHVRKDIWLQATQHGVSALTETEITQVDYDDEQGE
jgi:hypothetical protein